MIHNRSVPVNTILPHVVYADIPAAIEWLGRAFAFVEHYHYGEPAQGAQMHLGEAWIMLKSARQNASSPAQAGRWTQSLTLFVENVDAHYERARSAGARIIEELNETAYGERQFGVLDLEGHPWLFSTHAKDVSPGDWGATVVHA